MAIKRGSKVETSFGQSAMTDLVFLLLMFFMMASTLISPNALKLTLPRSNNQVREKPYTTLSITSDLQYYIDGTQRVSFNELEKALQAKLGGMEEPLISLHYDKDVPIDEFVKVTNIAVRNNYKLMLATSPE